MKNFVVAPALVAAALLPACASTPPASPSPPPATPAASVRPDAMNATQAAAALGMPGYRLEVRKGVEYYCRKEAVTGSRMEVHETCRTREEMERVRANTQEGVRRMQRPPEDPDLPNAMPGAGGY